MTSLPVLAVRGTREEITLFESDDAVATSTDEATLVTAVGTYTSCDVWFDAPRIWYRSCRLRLYGTVGSVRALLAEASLNDLDVLSDEERVGGQAISFRGLSVSSFELTAQLTSGEEGTDGKFYLQAWSGLEPLSVAVHRRAQTPRSPSSRAGRRWRSYAASSPTVSTGTSMGETSLAYLFHTGGSQRIEIDKITWSGFCASSSGSLTVRVARISAEASSPGGTLLPASSSLDLDERDATARVRHGASGAPTRSTDMMTIALAPTSQGSFAWRADDTDAPITLRPGVNEGVEIRAKVEGGLSSAASFAVNLEWREIDEEPRDLSVFGFSHEWVAHLGLETVVAGGRDEVTSWKDRLQGAEFAPLDPDHRPALIFASEVASVQFVGTNAETLDHPAALFDPNEDFTILCVVKFTSADGYYFGATSAISSGSSGPIIGMRRNPSYTSWMFFFAADGTSPTYSDTANYTGSSTDWHTILVRRSGNTYTVRAKGTNASSTSSVAALNITKSTLGALRLSTGLNGIASCEIRHFAVAQRALSDAEFALVESLMATYWPGLP